MIALLAEELSLEYARGFSARNLRNYRQLYLCFNDLEIWYTRVPNLKWSHYRTVLSVTSEDARYWYVREASTQSWNVRTLARNVGSQYYYRLLQSPKKEDVIKEMAQYSVLHDSKQLFAAKYLPMLPTEEVLRREIEQQKEIFYLQHNKK